MQSSNKILYHTAAVYIARHKLVEYTHFISATCIIGNYEVAGPALIMPGGK